MSMGVFNDLDFPYGMRCGNDCDFVYQEGDEIHTLPISMFEDGTPVEKVICWRCAVGVGTTQENGPHF